MRFPLSPYRRDWLARMDAAVYRCECGAWRLPEQYMNRPHSCGN